MTNEDEPVEEQRNLPGVLRAETGRFSLEGGAATFWLTASFAPQWYEDSLAEAQAGGEVSHRRKEILFAICCAESYLLEWVRDEVLCRNYAKLCIYYPHGARRGVAEKWKAIMKALESDGLIPKCPDLSTSMWQDFMTLLDYRDGIVHARVSRPESPGLPDTDQPVPSKYDRDRLGPGWPTKVVTRLIAHLHSELGTKPPKWLIHDEA